MEKQFDVTKYIEDVGQKLVSEIAGARKHGVDSNATGLAIESATRRQLKLLLPDVLDVGQGYIIDSHGNVSRQIDLVIYERAFCPVFSINESSESTYYPREGVIAAVEIKSRTGKKEFMDSCEKANSVRKLQRKFAVSDDGTVSIPRRYGQVELTLGEGLSHNFDQQNFPYGEILTGLVTGELSVNQDTLSSYYDQVQRCAPVTLISLDGMSVVFGSKTNELRNARLGEIYDMSKRENPFSRFVALIYFWFCRGVTAPLDSFGSYFRDSA